MQGARTSGPKSFVRVRLSASRESRRRSLLDAPPPPFLGPPSRGGPPFLVLPRTPGGGGPGPAGLSPITVFFPPPPRRALPRHDHRHTRSAPGPPAGDSVCSDHRVRTKTA